jgi:multimeric flavodoxin WrbA
MTDNRKFLFLVASTREAGHVGNTEWLARQAAATLPQGTTQQWMHLARMHLPPFVDLRHTAGQYPMPEGDLKTLLDATLAATDIVLVAPVYWYSLPLDDQDLHRPTGAAGCAFPASRSRNRWCARPCA